VKCPSCRTDCPEQAEACFTCGKALFALTQGTLLGGRYEIVSPVGKGGMSRVYKAYDRVLSEPVAIKVLRAELAWEAEMRQRFLHEIRLARRVSHPNVCRIHEYGEDGPVRYISMELVDGVNLKDVLRSRGLSTEEAFELALQMSAGLHAVHQHGIIHRDTKASNIMVDRQGVTKLMDFGIAKQAELDTGGFTTPGQVLGTPEYMSPEHARGGKIDFRSDIYALGCVVFEIFTGQAPFRGANAFATISKHFYEPAPLDGPLAALIPESLVPVLRKALAKEPSRRYANVSEMREALREAQRDTLGEQVVDLHQTNGVGSPRLQRLCETLLSRAATAPAHPIDNSSASLTPMPGPSPVKAPPITDTAPSPRGPRGRRRPLLVAAAVGGLALAAGAWSVLVWPANGSDGTGVSAGAASGAAAAPAPVPVTVSVPTQPVPSAAAPSSAPSDVKTTAPLPAPPSTAPPPSPAAERAAQPSPRAGAPFWRPLPSGSADAPGTRVSRAKVPEPAAPSAARGTLRLLVVPAAQVVIDGAAVGSVSLREIPLVAGAHTVTVLHPDYKPLNRKVTIQAATVSELLLDLAEKGVRKTP
jgi:eukaryotic-like serine/threonine-protein kinase